QEQIRIDELEQSRAGLPLVDAGTDGRNRAAPAQVRQRTPSSPVDQLANPGFGLRGSAMGETIDVVHEQDVDAVPAQPRETLLVRAHHAVIGIVEAHFQVRHVLEDAGLFAPGRARLEQAADFRRKDEAVLAAKRATEPDLRKTVTIERRSIEIADSARPSGGE